MAEPGTVYAGRYRLERKLGTGGMAVVWAAHDEVLGRRVAVKALHVPSEDGSRRFTREARIGAQLRHPNLVTIYDVIDEGVSVLLVMELVEGPSLAELLAARRLPPDEALGILEPVASALDAAHGAGVVHRDVKPANILVGADGRPRLADLGIATAAAATRITQSGTVLGTPAYIAPEQLEGEAATPASDVYSLAAVAFEMLAGQRARTGGDDLEIVRAVRTEPAPRLREHWPQAPAAADAVLARAMDPDPSRRPPSAGAFAGELAAALREGAAAAAPAPPPRPAATARSPGRRTRPASRAVPPPAPRRDRHRAAAVAALVLGAVAAVVAAAVLSAGGGDGGRAERDTGRAGATTTATATPGEEPTAAATAPPSAQRPPAAARAVRAFYQRAARDDFAGAWAIAGPGMRTALGGEAGLRATLQSLESIEFEQLDVTARDDAGATVAVTTVARHTDRVERCRGTVRAVRVGGRWRADTPSVHCDEISG